MIETINTLLSLGTILLQIAIIITVVVLVTKKISSMWITFISRHALLLSFLVALSGVVASLFYSQIAGYTPCILCWWQRIFIYPQVILFALALKKKEYIIMSYAFILSIIGSVFVLYQNYLTWGGTAVVACPTTVSCTQRYVFEFGYITIPMMSLTLFAGLLTIYWVWRRGRAQLTPVK